MRDVSRKTVWKGPLRRRLREMRWTLEKNAVVYPLKKKEEEKISL